MLDIPHLVSPRMFFHEWSLLLVVTYSVSLLPVPEAIAAMKTIAMVRAERCNVN